VDVNNLALGTALSLRVMQKTDLCHLEQIVSQNLPATKKINS
jgi:hypothetical protein